MMKTAITISLDKDLLRAGKAAASAARRSFSAQIEQWIEEKIGSPTLRTVKTARPSRKAKGGVR